MDGLRSLVLVSEGKSPNPTAGIIDARTNKVAVKYVNVEIGYDAGKKTKGRKQHIIVDTLGLPIAVQVHAADIQDRDGAILRTASKCDFCRGEARVHLLRPPLISVPARAKHVEAVLSPLQKT